MLIESVLDYVQRKGWPHKVVNEEIILQICPFCKDKGSHFYFNTESEVYYCHKCDARGNMYSLKTFSGDLLPVRSFEQLVPEVEEEDISTLMAQVEINHRELLVNPEYLKHLLVKRKFSMQAIKFFKLGIEPTPVGDWLWYPYWRKGMVKNVKMRTLPPAEKAFRRWRGGESLLFNEDALDETSGELFITEGESDSIALWSKGIKNVVGVTVGAKGIKSDWVDKLDKFERIYFAYDTDIAGNTGAGKFATRLGLERCWRINLPNGCKDVNEFFGGGGTVDGWKELVSRASRFDVESVRSLSKVLQDSIVSLYNQTSESNGIPFPWENLNRLAGHMMPGDLWIIASKPKVGKSTIAFNIIYNLAKNNIPCLLWSLEMRPERMMPRIVALHLRKDSQTVNTFEDMTKAYQEMREFPFYFAYGYRKLDFGYISDTIRQCLRRYGIQFMVFDNLHFLARSKDHMTQEISIASQNFKLLAEELSIPILLIARPKKTGGKMMQAEDLAWSADLEADADGIILLHREEKHIEGLATTEGVFEEDCLIRVNRIRYTSGGTTHLRAIDAEARFEEL
uniref:Putative helicase n=1 Tax=viral metagenome TaxID=1070528 RepID=A0A6M3IX39_9ZZZZ